LFLKLDPDRTWGTSLDGYFPTLTFSLQLYDIQRGVLQHIHFSLKKGFVGNEVYFSMAWYDWHAGEKV